MKHGDSIEDSIQENLWFESIIIQIENLLTNTFWTDSQSSAIAQRD